MIKAAAFPCGRFSLKKYPCPSKAPFLKRLFPQSNGPYSFSYRKGVKSTSRLPEDPSKGVM